MGYLEEFRVQIQNRDFSKFWQLWEEYCTSDTVDVEEFIQILQSVKGSDLAKQLGPYIETALTLWETIKKPEDSYNVFKLLIDLQTTNSPKLADLSTELLRNKYADLPHFNEWLRLVGLRSRDQFQEALTNFDLLAHMKKGKFVYHTGGWGTGEIIDLSPVREQLTVEFENIAGLKHFTFANSFKNLMPLADESFLALRFAHPDRLEKEARENPVKIIKFLLQDLGPKTAGEIKDELCESVIPEKDWTKWWQATRSKLKKDTMVESPESLKESFRLRKKEVTHEERLHKAIKKQSGIEQIIQTAYSFVRDMPAMLKKDEVSQPIKTTLLDALEEGSLTKAQELQVYIFLESQFDFKVEGKAIHHLIEEIENFDEIIENVEIVAFKKRILTLIRENRKDWDTIFLTLLFTIPQSTLKEYMMKELNQGKTAPALKEALLKYAHQPLAAPEFVIWYFQKLLGKERGELPFSDKEGHCLFLESVLILFSNLDAKPEYRELSKKIYLLLSGKRFQVVRQVIDGSSVEFLKEFLLLVAKCQEFSDSDIKILRSLAEVVHPSLGNKLSKELSSSEDQILWATEEAYRRIQERMQHISSIEMIENAREVEAARALGDLRENSEYKFAVEKRSRLQSELRHLAEQIRQARIVTKADIHPNEIGIGSIVELSDEMGKEVCYTLLGPWDADIDKGVLSLQSKLAQAMIGKKKGETFSFRDEKFLVVSIKNFLDK